jgi:hypothetical protein
MIQDKIFFDEKDPTGLSYNTPFTVFGSYQGRLWSKTPSGEIKYYTQNSDLSVYATTGSNQFNGNQTVTGSLTVTGGITGTVTTASYVQYSNVANKPTLVSSSAQITYSGVSGKPEGIVSSSVQVRGYNVFATTGSNQFNGSQSVTGSLTVTGQVVAQTLNVQQVTSSIVYSSGSNIFGNSVSNTQQFTGSLQVSGSSHYLLGNVGIGTISPETLSNNTTLQIDGTNHSFVRTGNSNYGGYFATIPTAEVLCIANVRNPVTGTYNNTGKAASGINLFSESSNGYITFLTTATNNSGPSERLRIDSNGTMMLGGTSSTGTAGTGSGRGNLILGGSTSNKITFNNNSTTINGYVYSDGSELQISSGAGYMNFYTGNSESMRITSGGNVGIGTIDPDRLFHINGNTSTTTPLQKVQNIGTGDAVTEYRVTGASWYVGIDNSDTDKFKIGQDPLGTSDRFTIVDGGNVGIGTNTPSINLHVSGLNNGGVGSSSFWNFNFVGAELTNTSNTANTTAGLALIGGSGRSSVSAIANIQESTSLGALGFFTGGSGIGGGTVPERMRITSGGNVLIGTTSDNENKLQVNGRLSFYGTAYNLRSVTTITNNNLVTISDTIVANSTGFIVVMTAGGRHWIPFYGLGGAGVGYYFTILNPSTGSWIVNQYNPTITIVTNGSNSVSITVNLTGGGGEVKVQQSSGTANYTIEVYIGSAPL